MKRLISILLLFVFASCVASDNLTWYRKLQESVSYEARMKENEAFKKKNAKDALDSEQDKAKEKKKKEREQAEIDAIYEKIRNLKSNNQ